jgi:peptide/nickel transport system permease protein
MLSYVARRCAIGVAIFVCVTALAFFLLNLQGSQAIAANLLGPNALPEQIEAKADQLGLDRPTVVRYLEWFVGLFRGDFGRSFLTGQPVTEMLATRIPVTVSVLVLTLLLSVTFGVVVGLVAATRGGLVDRALQGLYVLLHMIPGFLLALLIVIVFAVNLRLFPATGFIPIQRSFSGWLATVTLPSISIALGGILGIALWVRASVIDLLRLDFVRTLRSRGISERTILLKHVLRNAAPPTLTIFGFTVIGLLSGVIFVERIYALPGLGQLALTSGQSGDIPAMLGVTSFMVVVVVFVNLAVDVANGILNPKSRLS